MFYTIKQGKPNGGENVFVNVPARLLAEMIEDYASKKYPLLILNQNTGHSFTVREYPKKRATAR